MTSLPLVEVHVVHHCNLNCAGCAHFAPLADGDWFLTAQQLRLGLTALKAAGVDVEMLRLFGGEPTLHPALGELLVVARDALPGVELRVMTNGTMYRDSWLPLLRFFKQCNAKVEITRYPTVQVQSLVNLFHDVNVPVLIYHDAKQLRHHTISDNCRLVDDNEQCIMRDEQVSVQLVCTPKPTLWSCPVPAYSWIARQVFSDFPVPGDDCYVLLDHVVTADELARFAKPTSFCAHCTVGLENLPWTVSKRDRLEW